MGQVNENPSSFWVFFARIWGHIAISLAICWLSYHWMVIWTAILPCKIETLSLYTEYAVMPRLHICMAFLILLGYIIIWMVNYHCKANALTTITILLVVFDFLWLLITIYAGTLPCHLITLQIGS